MTDEQASGDGRERVAASFAKQGLMRTLAQAEVFAVKDGAEKLVAVLTATLMAVAGREGVVD